MTTEIEEIKPFSWKELNRETLKAQIAPTLDAQEFQLFMQLGSSLGANPFTREIFAIKYGKQKASIFCGRDFYRRKSQEQSDWNGMASAAIYENDDFYVENGIPKHKFSLKNRGKVIGAYCTVYRKGIDVPFTVVVDFQEYYLGNLDASGKVKQKKDWDTQKYVDMKPTIWDEKPATMIEKVAQAQALRGAYQGVFSGTFDESEKWKLDEEKELNPIPPQTEQKETLPTKQEEEPKTESEPVHTPQVLPPEQKETKPAKEEKAAKDKKSSGKNDPQKFLNNLRAKLSQAIEKENKEAFELVIKEWNDFKDAFEKAGCYDKGLEIIQEFKEKV